MEKPTILVLMLGIIGVVAWRLRSSPKPRAYGAENGKDPGSNPYYCVSIRSRQDACEAAKQVIDKRFLAREAPGLPLANCTAKQCRCRYAHHEDRRVDGGDQRAPFKGQNGNGPDRRVGRDRRSYSPA